ncbi:phosphate acyltransferase PlsX [Burkholderiaceae bacterium FT117]|uniref:phosphate acyltransferase PlsX n=1 Tax=Zeimonas sediminis TaxID=2944268 RepID=UPI00234307F0|nr:phosphate acyltransferase PlsX [Zeimonas sediminis]MCM5569005.1 phosphate acyltransferase PlsX [Zeimonas sediminis]
MSVRVAIDCMGGDHGLPVTIPAALSFLRHADDAKVVLVGISERIEQALAEAGVPAGSAGLRERVEVRHASEVVEMDDSLQVALRGKRDSSMRVAVELVRDGQADVCVSAGNTGALMAVSRFVLKTLDGIDRPAIATQMPNRTGGTTTVLDLGANVDCEPEHYLQFGIMGSALVSALGGPERPSVGLLNIGEEVIKGNDTVKQAAELLRASTLNFRGNVEGNDIYEGTTDVVVCDGFVGNVALKTSEGLARMLGDFIREEYKRHVFTRLMALLSFPVLRRFRKRLDHRRYNGASLVGLRGVVIKSHGSADAYAFEVALQRGYDAARNGLLSRIAQTLARMRADTPVSSTGASGGQSSPAAAAGQT